MHVQCTTHNYVHTDTRLVDVKTANDQVYVIILYTTFITLNFFLIIRYQTNYKQDLLQSWGKICFMNI